MKHAHLCCGSSILSVYAPCALNADTYITVSSEVWSSRLSAAAQQIEVILSEIFGNREYHLNE